QSSVVRTIYLPCTTFASNLPFHSVVRLRVPHSFPTRRSSDLGLLRVASGLLIALMVVLGAGVLIDLQRSAALTALMQSQAIQNLDRKSTRLNSSHVSSSYAVFCLQIKSMQLRGFKRPVAFRRH